MLPPIWCMLDKFWTILDHCLIGSKVMQRSAHVCVATSPCLTVSSACPPSAADYPVQVEMSQPFVCPLDHSYELPEMYDLGLDWREHSFFARSAHPTPSFSRGLREAITPPPSSSTHPRAARIPASPPSTNSLQTHPQPPLRSPRAPSAAALSRTGVGAVHIGVGAFLGPTAGRYTPAPTRELHVDEGATFSEAVEALARPEVPRCRRDVAEIAAEMSPRVYAPARHVTRPSKYGR